ncbi:MAG: MFS transporter [Candidatus Hermodarchaeota archaeon]
MSQNLKKQQNLEREGNRWRGPLFVLTLAVFIDMLGFGIVFPLLPFWTRSLGASEFVFGLLLATYSFFQLFFAPLWGRLSDNFGRRPIILIGLTGTFTSFVFLTLTASIFNSIIMLFFCRIIGGIFTSATLPTSRAYISDSMAKEEQVKSFGILGAGMALGMVIGPALGGSFVGLGKLLISSTNGYWFPLLFASVIALINLVAGIVRLPETLKKEIKPIYTLNGNLMVPRSNIPSIIKNSPTILILLAIFASVNFAFSSLDSILGLYVQDRVGGDEMMVGLIFMTAGLVMIIVQGGFVGILSRRISEPYLITTGLFLETIGFIGVTSATSFIEGIFWTFPIAFGNSLIIPILTSLVSKATPEDSQGAVLGINASLNALMRIIGPLIATFFYNLDIFFPWYVGACILAVALVLSLGLIKYTKRYGQAAAASGSNTDNKK